MKDESMNVEDIIEELKRISKMYYIPDRYAALRQLYTRNQRSSLAIISYAELLAEFNDDIYLERASTMCDNIIKNNNNFVGNAKLILYKINRKLYPKMKKNEGWYKELSDLQDDYSQKDKRLAKRIEYEMIKLIDNMFAVSDYRNVKGVESLKKQYNALLRSCDPGDHILRNDVCASYVTLLIHTKDYQGAKCALDFMKDHNYDLMHDFNRVYFYVQHKLGLIPENYQNITSYYESQILKYDRNRAIVHIYKHEKSENSDNLDIQTFDKDIDIRELFPTMEMAIEKIKPNERRMSTDIYYVNMGEIIGYFGNQPATIVAVLTEAGTKNIHTMYPVILCKNGLYKRREEALIRTNIKPTAEKSRQ